ncbi:DNA polymerase III subunit delta, partial [Bacteroidota bacterium]
MKKGNSKRVESIYNLTEHLKEKSFKPIYFLFGDDEYVISNSVKEISRSISPLVTNDFDSEIINVNKDTPLSYMIDNAYTFPFGSEKKLLIVKNFENFGDKKAFKEYINNPAEFTILIIIQFGKKLDFRREPYRTLVENGYLFMAKELKGIELQNWTIRKAKELEIEIRQNEVEILIDLVGENKFMIEMNLQKIQNYLGSRNKIAISDFDYLISNTKEYSVFNLQDKL